MNQSRYISEEHLNAFVDGQLSAGERNRLLAEAQQDQVLGKELCRLHSLKDMVSAAYQELPRPQERRSAPVSAQCGTWPWFRGAAAAVMLVMLGGVAGWFSHQNLEHSQLAAKATPSSAGNKVVLHLSSDSPQRVDVAIKKVEQLLHDYEVAGMPVNLEIIANREGLNLLKVNGAPQGQRVLELAERYGNVSILACRRTIDREVAAGHIVQLAPKVGITPTALDAIVSRLQQGWSYIQT